MSFSRYLSSCTNSGPLETARLLVRFLHLVVPLMEAHRVQTRWGNDSAESVWSIIASLFCPALLFVVAVGGLITASDALQELRMYFKVLVLSLVALPTFVFGFGMGSRDHLLTTAAMGSNGVLVTVLVRGFLEREDAPLFLPVSLHLAILPYLDSLLLLHAWRDASLHGFVPLILERMLSHLIVAGCLHHHSTTLIRERKCLKEVQESLKNLLAAQTSMWRSIFDASCICDASGFIVHASSQMRDLLSGAGAEEANREGLVGKTLPSFAASKEEKKRLVDFVRFAEKSTQQAVMVQTTLGVEGPTPCLGPGCHFEAKLFAIRFVRQPGCQPSTHSGIAEQFPWEQDGILVGMQLVEAKVAEVPHPRGGTQPASAQSLSIGFNAGTDRFDIKRLDPALCSGARGGQLEQLGLLDWLPRQHCSQFEKWVVQEVQRAPDDRVSTSVAAIEHLDLEVPVFRTRRLSAERAWLEMEPMVDDPVDGPSLPVTLRLAGVTGDGLLPSAVGDAEESKEDQPEVSPDDADDLGSTITDISMKGSLQGLVFRG